MSTREPIDRFVVYLYAAVIVFLFLGAAAIEKGEEVFLINGLHTRVLDKSFSWITNLGDGLIFIPIALLFAFRRYEYVVIAVSALVVHGLMSVFFKRVLFSDQLRPKEILDNSQLYFVPGVEVHSYNSFPSGHTMTAFCAAFLLSLVYKSRALSLVLLAVALLVGCSRIYLLEHFLIDVAGGALIGTFSAYIVWQFFSRKKMPEWASGRIAMKKPEGQ